MTKARSSSVKLIKLINMCDTYKLKMDRVCEKIKYADAIIYSIGIGGLCLTSLCYKYYERVDTEIDLDLDDICGICELCPFYISGTIGEADHMCIRDVFLNENGISTHGRIRNAKIFHNFLKNLSHEIKEIVDEFYKAD